MSFEFIVILLLAAAVSGFLIWEKEDSQSEFNLDFPPPDEPSLDMEHRNSEQPSLYNLIQSEVNKAPDAPLDLSKFPAPEYQLKVSDNGEKPFSFLPPPGAKERTLGQIAPPEFEHLQSILDRIEYREFDTTGEVEEQLKDLPAMETMNIVFRDFGDLYFTPEMRNIFWALAQHSRSYSVVKFGIALGSFGAGETEIDALRDMARHPELTPVALQAIIREVDNPEQRAKYLLEMIPISQNWGLIQVIEELAKQRVSLDEESRIKLVQNGMNHATAETRGAIALTIAGLLDLPELLEDALEERRLQTPVFRLMDALMNDQNLDQGLANLQSPEELLISFRKVIEEMELGLHKLYGLNSILQYYEREPEVVMNMDDQMDFSEIVMGGESSLEIDTETSEVDSKLIASVQNRMDQISEESVVKRALDQKETRDLAFRIIRDRELDEFLPDIRDRFQRKPEGITGEILVRMGNPEDLDTVLNTLYDRLDVEDRVSRPELDQPIPERDPEMLALYRESISRMRDAPVEKSRTVLINALQDYDPEIRNRSLSTAAEFPVEQWNDAFFEQIKQHHEELVHPETRDKLRENCEKAGYELPELEL